MKQPPDDEEIDHYVLRTSRIHYLICSLEDLLKNRAYVVFFDTNVLCGFHRYFEVNHLSEIDKGILARIRIFLTHLARIIDDHKNLFLTPPIREEMGHLISACLSACNKKIEEFQQLSYAERDRMVDIHNPIFAISKTLKRLQKKVSEHAYRSLLRNNRVLRLLEGLISYLSSELKLKKLELAEKRHDELLVAEAFHSILVNHRLVAIYSRDADIHRLVSTIFKVFVCTRVKEAETEYVQNTLFFRNLMLLSYKKDKDAWTRIFETTGQIPSRDLGVEKISEKKARKIVRRVKKDLALINQELADLNWQEEVASPAPTDDEVDESVETLFAQLQKLEGNRSSATSDQINESIRAFRALSVLQLKAGSRILETALAKAIENLRVDLLNCHLDILRERSDELKADLSALTDQVQQKLDLENTERLRAVVTQLSEVRAETVFFESAVAEGIVNATHEEYVKACDLRSRFVSNGYELGEAPCPVHPRELAYITGIPYTKVVKLVSERHIPVVDNAVSFKLSHLVHFV